MDDTAAAAAFDQRYRTPLKHLKLKGLQLKTIEAHGRAIRRAWACFEHRIDALTEAQLLEYFAELSETHPWGAVKLDLCGLKFLYEPLPPDSAARHPGYKALDALRSHSPTHSPGVARRK